MGLRSEAEGGVGTHPAFPRAKPYRQRRYGMLTLVPSPLLEMVKVPAVATGV